MNKIISMGKHNRTYNVRFHCHEKWELIYCTGGNGVIIQKDGLEIPYKKNDLIVIPPNVFHSNMSKKGFTNIHLNYDETLLTFTKTTKIADNFLLNIYHCISSCYYFWNNDVKNKSGILNSLGELLCDYVIAFNDSVSYSYDVEILVEQIIQNFSDSDFSISAAVEGCNKNADYIRKVFKKETSFTPTEFLIKTRINSAKRLLESRTYNKLTISEIAYSCGFSDPLYFSRAFKRETGVSPIDWTQTLDIGDKSR